MEEGSPRAAWLFLGLSAVAGLGGLRLVGRSYDWSLFPAPGLLVGVTLLAAAIDLAVMSALARLSLPVALLLGAGLFVPCWLGVVLIVGTTGA